MTEKTPARPAEPSKQDAPTAVTVNDVYRELLEATPVLNDEDENLYGKLHHAVCADLNPQTFLEKIAAMDFVDKLFTEIRCKTAIVRLIDAARRPSPSPIELDFLPTEEPSDFQAITAYLPHWLQLQRMLDNSEAGRRTLLKEFRRMVEASKIDDPETSTHKKTN